MGSRQSLSIMTAASPVRTVCKVLIGAVSTQGDDALVFADVCHSGGHGNVSPIKTGAMNFIV